jgi:hypothetical protein
MSHRIKAFIALAIFTLFYHLAALDSVSGLLDTKLELKSANPTTKFSLSDEPGFWAPTANESGGAMPGRRHRRMMIDARSKWGCFDLR